MYTKNANNFQKTKRKKTPWQLFNIFGITTLKKHQNKPIFLYENKIIIKSVEKTKDFFSNYNDIGQKI